MRSVVAGIALAGVALAYETACDEFGGKNVEYLDRHDVKCPAGHGLKHWTFTACGGGHFKASFECNALAGTYGVLNERYSGCSHLRGQNLEFLDRQNLACAVGEVMEGFKLTQDGCGGEDMRFKIYCRVFDGSSTYTAHARGSGCNEIDGQNLEYLDRHVPDCGADFMSQWYMTRSGCGFGPRQRIAATCLTLSAPTCDYGCYLNRYEDLSNAYGSDQVAAMNHYKDHGRGEGRDCTCPPPANCEGGWSDCDANCEKTYHVTVAAANGGAECEAVDGEIKTDGCSPGVEQCPPAGKCDETDNFEVPGSDECCPASRTVWDAGYLNALECCDSDIVNMDGSCSVPDTGAIDTLDKLKAWCSEDVANCRICKGKDQDDGSCKTKDKKIAKCKLFKNNDVCDRIVGCRTVTKVKKNKTKTACKGGKHGLA